MKTSAPSVDVVRFKSMISKAFTNLRKNGIYARMNFLCCQSCGCYEINDMYKDDNFSKKYKAWCFYHQQDNERLKNGMLHLSWGARPDRENSMLDTEYTALSQSICKALEDQGLVTEHNGTVNQRIIIKYPE